MECDASIALKCQLIHCLYDRMKDDEITDMCMLAPSELRFVHDVVLRGETDATDDLAHVFRPTLSPGVTMSSTWRRLRNLPGASRRAIPSCMKPRYPCLSQPRANGVSPGSNSARSLREDGGRQGDKMPAYDSVIVQFVLDLAPPSFPPNVLQVSQDTASTVISERADLWPSDVRACLALS